MNRSSFERKCTIACLLHARRSHVRLQPFIKQLYHISRLTQSGLNPIALDTGCIYSDDVFFCICLSSYPFEIPCATAKLVGGVLPPRVLHSRPPSNTTSTAAFECICFSGLLTLHSCIVLASNDFFAFILRMAPVCAEHLSLNTVEFASDGPVCAEPPMQPMP